MPRWATRGGGTRSSQGLIGRAAATTSAAAASGTVTGRIHLVSATAGTPAMTASGRLRTVSRSGIDDLSRPSPAPQRRGGGSGANIPPARTNRGRRGRARRPPIEIGGRASMPRLMPLSWPEVLDHLVKLGVAYLLALPIGWVQEREERSAGVRTFPLVAVASCGLVLVGAKVLGEDTGAQARVLEGLITGIGFIGGGAILKSGRSVQGTATAASIWNVGVIGAAAGHGLHDIAAILSALNLATLRFLLPLKRAAIESGEADRRPS